jgi:hypothetical protein
MESAVSTVFVPSIDTGLLLAGTMSNAKKASACRKRRSASVIRCSRYRAPIKGGLAAPVIL